MKSDTDKPRAIYPLNPGAVRVKIDMSSFPYKVSHYEYTLDGNIYRFQRYQIIHGKYPDPNDPFVGIGVPQTIPVWIDSDNYAMECNRKYFLNGAQIGLYVQSDTNVEGNFDRIKRGMRDEYGGVGNAHKIPVMPKGTKLEHTGVTHKDMDFENLSEATSFRVSKTILGTAPQPRRPTMCSASAPSNPRWSCSSPTSMPTSRPASATTSTSPSSTLCPRTKHSELWKCRQRQRICRT